jgi:hypothetical protein
MEDERYHSHGTQQREKEERSSSPMAVCPESDKNCAYGRACDSSGDYDANSSGRVSLAKEKYAQHNAQKSDAK